MSDYDNDNAVALRPGNGALAMSPAPLASGGLVSVEQQRALGELQAQIMLAKLYPRDQVRVVNDLKRLDCTRVGLAQQAEYSFSRGGQNIEGPSIRLMEAIARRWGNIQSGIKEVSRDQINGIGYSECVAYAWDLETGYRDEKQFRVRHVRDVRNRETRQMEQRPLTDERDVYELIANYGARRKRACLEAVIPGDVVEEIVDECRKTLQAEANTGPEAMKKLLAAFAAIGVTQRQIEARIQRNIDAIRPAQVVQLRKTYAAIRDGLTTPQAEFAALEPEPRPERPAPVAPPQAPPEAPPRTRQRSAANPPPAEPPQAQNRSHLQGGKEGIVEPPQAEPETQNRSDLMSPGPETSQEQPPDNLSGQEEPEHEGEFSYLLLNGRGEPIDGEVHLDPLKWAQGFLTEFNRLTDPTARGEMLQHNADAIAEARQLDPQADALLDGIEETSAESEASDPDEQIAANILQELPRLATALDVIEFSKSPVVMVPIQRWQQQGRNGLVASVRNAFTARLEALRRG